MNEPTQEQIKQIELLYGTTIPQPPIYDGFKFC